MKTCEYCHSNNRDDALSCSHCGAPLPETKPQPVYTMQQPTQYYAQPSQNTNKKGQTQSQKIKNNWKKVGILFLWLYFFPIMLTRHAIKQKNVGWWILCIVVWIITFCLFSGANSSSTP